MEAPSLPCFNLEQTFFGFKPEDRIHLHENIFNLIWYGEGRWDWDTIYNIPIFLRKFYVSQVAKILQERTDIKKQRADHTTNKRITVPNSNR